MNLDQQLAEVSAKLAKLQASTTPRQYTLQEERELQAIRERAEHVFKLNGKYLPDHTNESPLEYRKHLASILKVNCKKMRTHDLSKEPPEVFADSEAEIYADAQARYLKPLDLKPGEMRAIKYVDRTGRLVTEWAVGQGESVFKKVYGSKCIAEGKIGHFIYNDKPLHSPV